jgi:diazepam-binding inhibitor (GABA receptor modulating acyl-CoA-binding protein)
MNLQAEFESVVKAIQDTKGHGNDLTDNDKLDMYKFYKQATVGDCNIAEPWSVYFEAHAKWNAWNGIKGMSKEDAMQNYIDLYKNYLK